MKPAPAPDSCWNPADANAFVAWFDASVSTLPALAQARLRPLRDFLSAHPDVASYTRSESLTLLRAMGIIPSSERRASGRPLDALPPKERGGGMVDEHAKLEQAHERSVHLGDWHRDLNERHNRRAARLKEKLEKMASQQTSNSAAPDGLEGDAAGSDAFEDIALEDIELTEEEVAHNRARTLEFVEHLELGDGADPALQSANETLMPEGAVIYAEDSVLLPVEVPNELAEAKVVKTLHAHRTRYDFSMTLTRIDLDVEKKVVVTADGERQVLSASTAAFGPSRYSVTWSALATLAVMVCQLAIPFNRLATMISTSGKRFTSASLSRMMHYIAEC
jgi:hypothetical protein